MKSTTRWTLRAVIFILLAMLILPVDIPYFRLESTVTIRKRQPPLTRHVQVAKDSVITTLQFGDDSIAYFTTRMAAPIERPPLVDDAGGPTSDSEPP